MWWVDSRAHCDSWWNCWADIHDIPIPSLMFLVLLESDYSKFKPILNLWNKLTRHSLSLSLFFFQYFIINVCYWIPHWYVKCLMLGGLWIIPCSRGQTIEKGQSIWQIHFLINLKALLRHLNNKKKMHYCLSFIPTIT